MSAKGSRRSAGIISTTTQRTAEMSATCNDELPQRDPSTTAEIGSKSPLNAATTPKAENGAHIKAPFRALLASPLPSVSPARDDLSSLSYVSFSNREINNTDLREGLINVSQNMAILPKVSPRSWHRRSARRRASTAAEAPNERRTSGSRAHARLCPLSPYSAERRRDWSVMRD